MRDSLAGDNIWTKKVESKNRFFLATDASDEGLGSCNDTRVRVSWAEWLLQRTGFLHNVEQSLCYD